MASNVFTINRNNGPRQFAHRPRRSAPVSRAITLKGTDDLSSWFKAQVQVGEVHYRIRTPGSAPNRTSGGLVYQRVEGPDVFLSIAPRYGPVLRSQGLGISIDQVQVRFRFTGRYSAVATITGAFSDKDRGIIIDHFPQGYIDAVVVAGDRECDSVPVLTDDQLDEYHDAYEAFMLQSTEEEDASSRWAVTFERGVFRMDGRILLNPNGAEWVRERTRIASRGRVPGTTARFVRDEQYLERVHVVDDTGGVVFTITIDEYNRFLRRWFATFARYARELYGHEVVSDDLYPSKCTPNTDWLGVWLLPPTALVANSRQDSIINTYIGTVTTLALAYVGINLKEMAGFTATAPETATGGSSTEEDVEMQEAITSRVQEQGTERRRREERGLQGLGEGSGSNDTSASNDTGRGRAGNITTAQSLSGIHEIGRGGEEGEDAPRPYRRLRRGVRLASPEEEQGEQEWLETEEDATMAPIFAEQLSRWNTNTPTQTNKRNLSPEEKQQQGQQQPQQQHQTGRSTAKTPRATTRPKKRRQKGTQGEDTKGRQAPAPATAKPKRNRSNFGSRNWQRQAPIVLSEEGEGVVELQDLGTPRRQEPRARTPRSRARAPRVELENEGPPRTTTTSTMSAADQATFLPAFIDPAALLDPFDQ